MLDDGVVISRPRKMLTANLEDEQVIYHHASGNYICLDSIATRVWELCVEPIKFDTLVEILLQEYEVDSTTCRADVSHFLRDLQEKKLVDLSNG